MIAIGQAAQTALQNQAANSQSMNKWFPGNTSFTGHGNSTNSLGPGDFPCPQCNRRYRWKGSLAQHLRLECGKEPQFHCPYCPHRTKHKGNLNIHILGRHAGMPGIPVRSPMIDARVFPNPMSENVVRQNKEHLEIP